jgi:hypothetical protein
VTRSPAAQLLRAVAIAAIVLWSLAPIGLGVATSLSIEADVQAVPARSLPPSCEARRLPFAAGRHRRLPRWRHCLGERRVRARHVE